MNKIKYLVFIPTLFSLFSCNKKMPKRKAGDTCKITFVGDHVTPIDCPSEAPIDQELSFSLNIPYESDKDTDWVWNQAPSADEDGVLEKPNIEYNVHPEDIHVLIGGEEFKDSYQFFYMNNGNNKFTIKKEYMVNDIEINILAKPREGLFLYGYIFSTTLDKRLDYDGHDPYTKNNDDKDVTFHFGKTYQDVRYPIRTLSGLKAFPVFERDEITLTLEVKDESNESLPDNICYRRNARYTQLGVDYTREYSDDNRKCVIHVPYFNIDDHGSFCVEGEK